MNDYRPTTSVSPRRILAAHMVAMVLIQGVWFGNSSMMAVLARKRFSAGDWQTVMITACVPTIMVVSIFWGHLLQRVSIRKYLAIHWACTAIPLGAAGLVDHFWSLLACHALASAGASGWSPISGDLLKGFYGDLTRGRAFGLVNCALFLGMAAISLGIGYGLDINENAFRLYLPASTLAYGMGILVLRRLVHLTAVDEARRLSAARRKFRVSALLDPIVHLRAVLREDRTFFRFEAAFMTYGIGWMICYALLPVLATDRLHMTYTEFAGATQVIYPVCLVLLIYPMGWVMDRLGPARTSGLSFAWLAMYPIGLILAHTVFAAGAVTVIYGTGMAGVHMGWMLGPVALAPTREKVAHYVAIHASLVGLRGIFAQGLGMLMYRVTASFTWSFAVAAVAFFWAAVQMWKLHRELETAKTRQPLVSVAKSIP